MAKIKNDSPDISSSDITELLKTLKERFEKNKARHKDLEWAKVETKLKGNPKKLMALLMMETSGGEPDIINYDLKSNTFLFVDCSAESPKDRRSLCYDRQALDARKENKPKNSVSDLAATMGIELLTEEQYRHLQTLGEFDKKTSSWIVTPARIRKLGGALFCDRRYDTVFTYHNGADSYYAARGFRGALKV